MMGKKKKARDEWSVHQPSLARAVNTRLPPVRRRACCVEFIGPVPLSSELQYLLIASREHSHVRECPLSALTVASHCLPPTEGYILLPFRPDRVHLNRAETMFLRGHSWDGSRSWWEWWGDGSPFTFRQAPLRKSAIVLLAFVCGWQELKKARVNKSSFLAVDVCKAVLNAW